MVESDSKLPYWWHAEARTRATGCQWHEGESIQKTLISLHLHILEGHRRRLQCLATPSSCTREQGEEVHYSLCAGIRSVLVPRSRARALRGIEHIICHSPIRRVGTLQGTGRVEVEADYGPELTRRATVHVLRLAVAIVRIFVGHSKLIIY